MLVLENTPWMLLGEETTTTMQTGGYNQGATPYHDAGIDGGGGGGSYGFCSLAPNVGCTTIGGDSCTGGQGTCDTDTAQILTIVDTGIQLDAGDLSNERADAGWDIDHVIAEPPQGAGLRDGQASSRKAAATSPAATFR